MKEYNLNDTHLLQLDSQRPDCVTHGRLMSLRGQ